MSQESSLSLRRPRGNLESDHICISIKGACQLCEDILDTVGKCMHQHGESCCPLSLVPHQPA